MPPPSLWSRLRARLGPGAAAPRIEDRAEVDRLYKRLRASVIVTLVASYAISYTGRLGLGVVKKDLIDGGVYDSVQLGWIGFGYYWAYAVGKLVNGFFADRVNPRIFWPIGLAVCGAMNLAMGANEVAAVAVALWIVNGWFQGFGGPTCVVSMTQWFSPRERGTVYGVWSTAHAIGEALTFYVVGALVAATAWRTAFFAPGVLLLATAAVAYLGLRDRPETVGLPPVSQWKRDAPPAAPGSLGRSLLRTQLSLLGRPAIWVIGLASAAMYMTRYAINGWGVLYLQEAHGLSTDTASSLVALNAMAGIGGCVAYGFISDRLFGARRPPLTLIFGLLEVAGLVLVFAAPRGNVALLAAGFVLYGFTLSGILAVLGGLFAVDIAPREATGAAVGIIGVFSYLGAGLQDGVSGTLIDRGTVLVDGVRHYDFSRPIAFWVGASVLSMLLAATLWRVPATR